MFPGEQQAKQGRLWTTAIFIPEVNFERIVESANIEGLTMKNKQAIVLGAIAVLGLTGILVLARPLGKWLLAWFGDRQPMGRMHHGS